VPDAPLELDELVDLKMLPAWVSEPPPGERYAEHAGEDQRERHGRDRRERRGKRPTPNVQRPALKSEGPRINRERSGSDRFRGKRRDRVQPDSRRKDRQHHRPPVEQPLPPIAVKFLPRVAAFENVVAQIKSSSVAYSLFALARLFLEKAARHDVKLTAPPETLLFQLGEDGAISVNRHFLERNAFRFAHSDFYKIDIKETEPIKGNFTNVARDRLSGTLLGPTNHHDYQRRLRNLYEQRFSRRMSFPEYQRQIQIVTDPAEIEKWKDGARKMTTYSTLREEPPQTFSSVTEAERHFEKHYLPGLVRTVSEVPIDGPASRRLHDRVLNKVIENEWNRETKSPSPMMQELAARFREVGLYVFRHRRGMLFVTSIYPRPFTNHQTAVSSQVKTIVEAIAAQPRIGRKELADKLINASSPDSALFRAESLRRSASAGSVVDPNKDVETNTSPARTVPAADEIERIKLALASDLLWLISSGHVIEFNDGSLDLPRAKVKPKENETADAAQSKDVVAVVPSRVGIFSAAEQKENAEAAAEAAEKEARVEAGAPPAEEKPVAAGVSPANESADEIGGS
jgi:hypothetical protein